jgi:hypothetical protein
MHVHAQKDSIVFHNNSYLVGEVKSMDRGVVMMETSFSDKDFAIEWDKIKEIYCDTYFLIALSDGRRFNGSFHTMSPGNVQIVEDDGTKTETPMMDVVFMDDVDRGFWSKLYASIDVGFDLTKANNFRQVSMRSTLGYLAERWKLNAAYNTLHSTQDNTEKIERSDGGIGFNFYFKKTWFMIASLGFLSNTEQKLDLRSTLKGGLGLFMVRTNRKYWNLAAGVNYNNERFSSDDGNRNSMEGFIGSELNLYDIGDLNLLTNLLVYPSFTESGRIRSDFNIDTKYEMPFDDDFYIKIGVTLNYDNKPVETGSDTDYVFHTGFGWEW